MGALTLKTFSDELREWELLEGEGLDPTDGFGVALRLSMREQQIYLAEPSDLNNPWITDRGRLFFDGMFESGVSKKSNFHWPSFFSEIYELLYFSDHLNLYRVNSQLKFLFIFDQINMEMLSLLQILRTKYSLVEVRSKISYKADVNHDSSLRVMDLEAGSKNLSISTLCVLFNVDTRHEGSSLNIKLRQRVLKGNFKVFNIGSYLDLTFATHNLNSNFSTLVSLCERTHVVCRDIKKAKLPFMITNVDSFKRQDTKIVYQLFKYLNFLDSSWQSVNVLHAGLGSSTARYLNKFLPFSSSCYRDCFLVYNLNISLDNSSEFKSLINLSLLNLLREPAPQNSKYIWNQSCFDIDKEAKEISNSYSYQHLPTNIWFEDNEIYFNTEGRLKHCVKFLSRSSNNAKSGWQILRKLYSKISKLRFINNVRDAKKVCYNSLNRFSFKSYIHFHYYPAQTLCNFNFLTVSATSFPKEFVRFSKFKLGILKTYDTKTRFWLDDFFLKDNQDSFSHSSIVLLNCSRTARMSTTNFF